MTLSSSLNAERRKRELERLAAGEVVDVLVVGGGINGTGVALDAASRGLSVALLERRDLAFGTSRWSSKLIHGGLRYLAHGDFGLAWESARERARLMRTIAPHLVHGLPFLVPLGEETEAADGARVELGLRIGNAMRLAAGTGRHVLPRPRRIGAMEARRLIPGLKPSGLRGALLYWDGQLEDDARLVIAIARTAASFGARILTYCTVSEIRDDGVWARDELTGTSFEVGARHVVNATGVWAGDLQPNVRLQPSKGAHLIVPSPLIGDPRAALIVPLREEKGRWVFAVPNAAGQVLIGVTDDRYEEDERDAPEVTTKDVNVLLGAINRSLLTELEHRHVIGKFAGLRPLLAGNGAATADLSRRHAVIEDPESGALTLVGGKLTTYRAMAQDVVDRIAARPGVEAGRCRTTWLRIVGAGPQSTLHAIRAPERLVRRYGAEAPRLMELGAADGSLLEPIAAGTPVFAIELRFAIDHELALTVDDLLERRTRLSLVEDDCTSARERAEELLIHAGRRRPAAVTPGLSSTQG